MTPIQNKKIAVLFGGLSREREIALRSGRAVIQALKAKGYSPVEMDVDGEVCQKLKSEKIELAYLALHGRYGEDGCIQGMLEILQIPYTGSGVLPSALAMDKILTKRILNDRGFLTPAFLSLESSLAIPIAETIQKAMAHFALPFPVVVKPSQEGSTLGISVVRKREELEPALKAAFELDSRVLIEEFIAGRELTAAVLNGEPLPLVEVVPKSGFYDFQSKYTPGATEYRVPAPLSPFLTRKIQQTAVAIYQELGCEGVARSDFILDANENAYFLEINTLPGMTETSLVPKAAQSAGISFEDLVEKILVSSRLKNLKSV